jgi:ABC-type multidrug transport system fused ATPase/permease subunit
MAGAFSSSARREAAKLMREYRGTLALGLAAMVASKVVSLVFPLGSKYVIDEVIGKGRRELLVPIAAAVCAAALFRAGTSVFLGLLFSATANRAVTRARRSLQRHVVSLPTSFFDAWRTGALVSTVMGDADNVRIFVGGEIIQVVGSVAAAVVAVGVLFYLNWTLSAAILVVLLVLAAYLTAATRGVRRLSGERRALTADVSARLTESISGVQTVKAYAAERRESLVFTRGLHALLRKSIEVAKRGAIVHTVARLVLGLLWALLLVVGGRAILAGRMTLGDLFVYLFFVGVAAAPIRAVMGLLPQLGEALASLDRIADLERHAAEDTDVGEPLPEVRGDVEFKDVSFAYTPGVPALKRVSFRAPAGSTTALVGASGAGKSTLIGLVMAFHRPTSGRILVDSRDLATVRLKDYRRRLGVVLQQSFLFDGTVAENIAFGSPDADRSRIEEAGRVAHCDEFVRPLSEGYDARVGERGVKLSGGQRQRIAIARAILAEPRVLILDEATSSLDSESEALVYDGLEALRRGRTTFVIAHRLSTVHSADQILVLDAGEIVERGTHDELMAVGGRYRRLYDVQFQTNAGDGVPTRLGSQTPANSSR